MEKAWQGPGQVTGKKRTAKEPLMTCRKRRDDVETAGESLLRDQLRRNLFTDGAASGMRGGLSLLRGGRAERGNLGLRCKQRSFKWKNHESESTEAELRGGTTRSSGEVSDNGTERRGCVMELNSMCQPAMGGADE